jgi:hypothetical protein
MSKPKPNDIIVTCPCCSARLTIDGQLKQVIAHEEPPKPQGNVPDLGQAAALLREQAAKREAIFNQSSQEVKTHSQLLERKFAEALEKSKDTPITRPTREFDLD